MVEGINRESFSLNLKVMRVFGLFPPDRHKHLYKVFAYLLYFCFIVPIPLLGCIYLIVEEDVDLVKVSENAFLLAEMGCYITKYLPFINNGYNVEDCIFYFESSIFKVFDNDQQAIVDDCKRICRRNTKIFLCSVTCGVSSWAIKPLLLGSSRLPIDIWLPFSQESLEGLYHWVYLYLVIAVVYAAYCSGVSDPLVAGLALEATSQFKILKHKLQNLSLSEDLYKEIKDCVLHHKAILKFVKKYEECFSLFVFSQFMGSVVVICVSCFELTLMDPLSFNFLSMAMYLVTMLAEIYLFCYYGTTLYDESNTLTDAVYMGKWYEYDNESKKALTILMECSNRPVVVSAGKILDLSLVTFTTILRRSYSLFAVLNNYK